MNGVWSFITSEGLFTFREYKYQWKSRCLSREHFLLSSERASFSSNRKEEKKHSRQLACSVWASFLSLLCYFFPCKIVSFQSFEWVMLILAMYLSVLGCF